MAPIRVAMHTSAAGIMIAFACAGMNDAQAQQKETIPITLVADTGQSGVSEPAFANAIELHNAGRSGDSQAVTQAVEAFEDLVKADGSDPIANAYLGSSYTLMGREAKSGPDKLRYTNRGLRYLDTAVALAPDNFTVLVVRANVQASLPAMFLRQDDAIKDLLALDAMFAQAQSPAMANAMIEIYGLLSELAPEAGDWAARAQGARHLAGQ